MTTKQKAKQLALTLIGEDQNPEPLIDVLMEMALWQREQMMKDTVSATVISDPDAHGADYGLQKLDVKFKELESKGFKSGTKVKLIIIKED